MKWLPVIIAACMVLLAGGPAFATPAQDRQNLVNYFTGKFPAIKLDQYVYGSLAFDPDSMAQYNSIMDFPPFGTIIDQAQQMWNTPFRNGKTYASCFPGGGKNVAGNYPYFDNRSNQVVTFEMAINACRTTNGEPAYSYGDPATMGKLTAYARTLSDGMLMNVKVDGPAAQAAFEAGKKIFYARRGQLGFSCASCHVMEAGARYRSEILSPVLGQATHWPVFRGGDANLVTLQARFAGCDKMLRAQPFAIGSPEYNDLEYFYSYISNGLPLKASVFRK
ncbi:MAG: sulfur oxidation c-type cytochrome SoxA [Burkholderiales bacterium]